MTPLSVNFFLKEEEKFGVKASFLLETVWLINSTHLSAACGSFDDRFRSAFRPFLYTFTLSCKAGLMSSPRLTRQNERENMKTISFVIPVYNEENRIEKTFQALRNLSLPKDLILESIIFVDDGSDDNSKSKIQNSKLAIEKKTNAKVAIVSYKKNRGKGYAVRQGMFESKSDYTLFFDADISTPLGEINKFIPSIKKEIDVIIGTRKNGKSTVIKHQPLYREILGKGFTYFTKFFLNLQVTDFTCGFKAFSKRAKEKIFKRAIIDGWSYDPEIILIAKKFNFKMQEVPVLWSNDDRTKVNLFKDMPKIIVELFKIKYEHTLRPETIILQDNFRFIVRKISTAIISIFF